MDWTSYKPFGVGLKKKILSGSAEHPLIAVVMSENLQRLFGQLGAGAMPASTNIDTPTVDTAEMVYISSLALLKMLKHGRAGVPMEVMGLMLGEFVDEYTVRVIDVFAMPQSGTGVSVEAVDPVFQVTCSRLRIIIMLDKI